MTKQQWITALRGQLGLAHGPVGDLGDLDGLDDLAEQDSLADLDLAVDDPQISRIQALQDEIASWETGIKLLSEELDAIIAADDLDEATAAKADTLFAQLDARLGEAIAQLQQAISELES